MAAPLIQPPRGVLSVAQTLERAGFDAWCVGGAVRDAMLGQPGHDWDLASRATPTEVKRLFPRHIPTGEVHGTITVRDPDGEHHELTTFRKDVSTDGRNATVRWARTIEDDLARRDFTINAIAFRPATGQICDPFGGGVDLKAGRIAAVGNPSARMEEDRLRALRALRFAARFGFEIDPATWEAIVASAPHMDRLSQERVNQELDKTMIQAPDAGRAIAAWFASGQMAACVPAFAGLSDAQQAVILGGLQALPMPMDGDDTDRRALDRKTALFITLGQAQATQAVRRLRVPTAEALHISEMAARLERTGEAIHTQALHGTPTEGLHARRLAAELGRARVAPFFRVASALWNHGPTPLPATAQAALAVTAATVESAAFSTPLELKELALTGEDLIAAGMKGGPAIGAALRALQSSVIDDPARNTRDQLLDLASRQTTAPPAPKRPSRHAL